MKNKKFWGNKKLGYDTINTNIRVKLNAFSMLSQTNQSLNLHYFVFIGFLFVMFFFFWNAYNYLLLKREREAI